MKHSKRPLTAGLMEAMGVPKDLADHEPILTSYGTSELTIENYRCILEYTGSTIRLLSRTCRILVSGEHLKISYYSGEEMKITGKIQGISFQNLNA